MFGFEKLQLYFEIYKASVSIIRIVFLPQETEQVLLTEWHRAEDKTSGLIFMFIKQYRFR